MATTFACRLNSRDHDCRQFDLGVSSQFCSALIRRAERVMDFDVAHKRCGADFVGNEKGVGSLRSALQMSLFQCKSTCSSGDRATTRDPASSLKRAEDM